MKKKTLENIGVIEKKKKKGGGGTQPTNIWWTINGLQLWALFEQEKSLKGMDYFI